MTMVSYAQNHEDVLLDRAFARGRPGFYIDVGANDPVTYSVTKHFYDLGWHGINVEPSERHFAALEAARPRDVNCNVALAAEPGELVFHEFPPEFSGLSTLSAEDAERHRQAGLLAVERRVPAMTLAQLCQQHVTGPIDFLSVDVEGFERDVLAGGDWSRWRPRVVVVEATEPAGPDAAGDPPRLLIPTHATWEPILRAAGYRFATFDGLNRYYVAEEEADLARALAVPVNVADGYVSYAYLQMSRLQTADWLANQSLRAEFRDLAAEVRALRQRAEELQQALDRARELHEAIRTELAAGLAAADEVAAEVEALSPAGIAVARNVTAATRRFPGAAGLARRALRPGRNREQP
ncbi:MAG TPA: FkbM family methyltransferase [Actinomycetota bacterium]|nr:FkbM family methyltransferase [Actinomycetota bacterium]